MTTGQSNRRPMNEIFEDIYKNNRRVKAMTSPNEFPVRLDERALNEIANKSSDNDVYVRVNQIMPSVSADQLGIRATLATLIALQEYLKERRVDPGFQVVLGE
jgi:hypothetical protein